MSRVVVTAALVALAIAGCSSGTHTVTKTVTLTPPAKTVTVTVTPAASGPAAAAGSQPTRSVAPPAQAPVSTSHRPQGTVSISFTNDVSNTQNCSNTTVHVANQSDTPVLSITVTFQPSWDYDLNGNVGTENMPAVTMTQPAGIAAWQHGDVPFAVCVGKPSFDISRANFATVDAVPKSFRWVWATS